MTPGMSMLFAAVFVGLIGLGLFGRARVDSFFSESPKDEASDHEP